MKQNPKPASPVLLQARCMARNLRLPWHQRREENEAALGLGCDGVTG